MADISKIKLPEQESAFDLKDADARSSLYNGAVNKNINMSNATSVKAPTINYDTYDETTQASCVATMGAMLQTIKKMTESTIDGSQLILSGFDNIQGTTLVLN